MITPYDWQEGIGNRAEYIEGKLAHGIPVVAVSLPAGILLFTFRRQTRKLFEVYDRLAFGGVGQQSDIEAIRTAAVDFASREGYQRSEQDVTIQRVATSMSQPIKRAFADFSTAPFVVRCLFAEVNDKPENDLFYTLDYTGDFNVARGFAVVAGKESLFDELQKKLSSFDRTVDAEGALASVREIVVAALKGEDEEDPSDGLHPEALLIERSDVREDRFTVLTPEDQF